MCSDWSDDEDMQKIIRNLYCKANTLVRKFTFCSESIRVYLFQMYCGNIYCSSLWCNYKQTTYNKIRIAYNNAFRILIHLPTFCSASNMFVSRNTLTFEVLLRRNGQSLMQRIRNSNNLFVSTIFNSDVHVMSVLFKRFRSLLFI